MIGPSDADCTGAPGARVNKLATGSMSSQPPPTNIGQTAAGFAIPPRLHVGVLFMIQFVFVLALFGGVVPTLHKQGFNLWLLIAGSAAGFIAVHLGLGFLFRLLPVRCRHCRSRSYFRGFMWWPFIYRYHCSSCGQEMRFEVQGG